MPGDFAVELLALGRGARDDHGVDVHQGREGALGVHLVVSLDGPDGEIEVALDHVVLREASGADRLAGASVPAQPTSLHALHHVEAVNLEGKEALDRPGQRGVDRDRGLLVGLRDQGVDVILGARHRDEPEALLANSLEEVFPVTAERGDDELVTNRVGEALLGVRSVEAGDGQVGGVGLVGLYEEEIVLANGSGADLLQEAFGELLSFGHTLIVAEIPAPRNPSRAI